MATILKKSSFTDEGGGRFTRNGHIEPVTDNDVLSAIDQQDQPINYVSTNENVFTVEPDPDDKKKFKIVWVGAGTSQLQATGDADRDPGEVTTISGAEEYTLEEDEATKLKVVLD